VKHFCDELKAAREFKKVTLEEISTKTKIDITFLKALEDGRWDILPEPYIKGFLKAYAQSVGMNVLKVLKKYDELEKGITDEEDEESSEPSRVDLPPEPPSLLRSRFPAVKVKTHGLWYGLLVVVIVIVGIWVLSIIRSKPAEEPDAPLEEQTTTIPADSIATPQTVPDTTVASAEPVPMEPFTVGAKFSDPCYVEIVLDDTLKRDYLFQAGQSKTWDVHQLLWIKIGNSGGAEISHDDSVLGVLGVQNQVVTLTMGPDGVIEKILGPEPEINVPEDSSVIDSE
jgi:hypothetical protein